MQRGASSYWCPARGVSGSFLWNMREKGSGVHSRKGPRHNQHFPEKRWETPDMEIPGFSFCQFLRSFQSRVGGFSDLIRGQSSPNLELFNSPESALQKLIVQPKGGFS